MPTETASAFLSARDFLLRHRTDYDTAVRDFRWPVLERFNWALDYFDAMAAGNDRPALHIVGEDGSEVLRTFRDLSSDSNRVANYLHEIGARRGDRLMVVLGNELALWETFLAAMKLGVVVIPATALLTRDDLQDRIDRGRVRHVVAAGPQARKIEDLRGDFTRTIVNGDVPGWRRYEESREADARFVPDGETRATDPLLLYFTSGTTAKPKLVLHTHESYPVGHRSTLYWIGLLPTIDIGTSARPAGRTPEFFSRPEPGATVLSSTTGFQARPS
jgi:acetyl-CoA synthetase